jgi:paraquat-inducible protein B
MKRIMSIVLLVVLSTTSVFAAECEKPGSACHDSTKTAVNSIKNVNLSECEMPPVDQWAQYDKALEAINQHIYDSLKPLCAEQEKIRKTVEDISQALDKTYDRLQNANLLSEYVEINQYLDGVKAHDETLKKTLQSTRERVISIEQKMATLYCQVNKARDYFEKKSAEVKKLNQDASTNYKNTASQMHDKAKKIYILIEIYDRYVTDLDNLIGKATGNIEYLNSLQAHVVSFNDVVCKTVKTDFCHYQFTTDPRKGKAEMVKAMIATEKSFNAIAEKASVFTVAKRK